MNGYEQFLVVILSSFLAIFLLLGIVLFILLIKIAQTVKRLTEKAEELADKAEAVGDFFKQAAGPMALGRALSVIADTFFRRKSSKRDDK